MKKSALDDPSLDKFTHLVLSRIEPDVMTSLTEHQYAAIRHAVERCKPIARHSVDIRGTISFFFARYYYVFLTGRDHREQTESLEHERRAGTESALGSVALGAAILIPIIMIVLLLGNAILFFVGW